MSYVDIGVDFLFSYTRFQFFLEDKLVLFFVCFCLFKGNDKIFYIPSHKVDVLRLNY